VSEGTLMSTVIWTVIVGCLLLAWPWLLAWLHGRRPALVAGLNPVSLQTLVAVARRGDLPRPWTLLAWVAVCGGAALMPVSAGLLAADLDAGLFWLMVLTFLALAVAPGTNLDETAGGFITLAACLTPVVLRASSLNLADLAIAQQGGVSNWYLLHSPTLLLLSAVFLVTIAAFWAPRPSRPRGSDGLLRVTLWSGIPMVLALLLTVTYLGGWYAFVPAVDPVLGLNTLVKLVVVVMLVVWLRGRLARRGPNPRLLRWLLPSAALLLAAVDTVLMVTSGAVQ